MIKAKPLREAEVYGDACLSVQASSTHYSTPRVDGLDFDQYAAYEVGLIGPEIKIVKTAIGEFESDLCRPSEIGIAGFDHLFENGDCPVAAYVSKADVGRLRDALRARAAVEGGASA